MRAWLREIKRGVCDLAGGGTSGSRSLASVTVTFYSLEKKTVLSSE